MNRIDNTFSVNQLSDIRQIETSNKPQTNVELKPEDNKVREENDFLAISEDGDTLSASKAGINASVTNGKLVSASEDGAVTQIDEDAEDIKQITSLAGYTRQQVEDLYSKGLIDRMTYERNMELREERTNTDEEKDDLQTSDHEEDANAQKMMDDQKAFAESMGDISRQSMDMQIRAKAYTDALNNDRADIVNQIFK